MVEKFSVLIKYKYIDYIENAKVSDADAWIFIKGIIEYDKTGKEPVYVNPVLTGIFAVVKSDIDQNRENWEAVSGERKKSGKKGAEARWGKEVNGKNSNSYSDKANMANDSKCQKKQNSMAKMHDLDLDLDLDSDSNISGCAGAGALPPVVSAAVERPKKNQKPERPKKPPLREREPENDMERVEKAYLQNWAELYAQDRLATPEPIVNWNQTRALLKIHFAKLKPGQVIQALNSGMDDEWVITGGYSLAAMLSASVLNRLINAMQGPPPETNVGADAVFSKARDLWNELKVPPECRDASVPHTERECLRAFQNYSWEEIENAINNYDYHRQEARDGSG